MTDVWLKCKKEVVFLVDYNDLDKAIQRYFGRADYNSVAANEWNNYSSYEFDVDSHVDDYSMGKIDKFRAGTGWGAHITEALLCKMCADNVIEPGRYIVKVYW